MESDGVDVLLKSLGRFATRVRVIGGALGPSLAAMQYLLDLNIKPFQVVGYVFNVYAALFG